MATDFPASVAVDYAAGENEGPESYPQLADKIEKAVSVTETAFEQYDNPAIMWTGGKDSTLVLYVVMEVARKLDRELPPVVFIDHFEHFPEAMDFVERWSDEWGLDLIYARNSDIVRLGADPGDEIAVSDLSESTQDELDKLDYDEDSFVLDADTFVGNHLLKTVALNEVLTEHGFDGIFSGVRWDEQDARADETFFSPRHESEKYPPHDRVHPILQFEESAVWDAFWHFVVPDTVEDYPEGYVPESTDDLPDGVEPEDIPVSPKYFEGFRSLGTESGSAKSDNRPAWLQDLEGTTEREGRAQDKENIMERLRDLGYM
ncbi:phosphoadenosine phosphosulfate reductase family protein [Haloferacaceae archaeon DSL9]